MPDETQVGEQPTLPVTADESPDTAQAPSGAPSESQGETPAEAPAKKAPAKKAAAKKTAAKKAPAKKAAAKKTAAKKAPAKKAAAVDEAADSSTETGAGEAEQPRTPAKRTRKKPAAKAVPAQDADPVAESVAGSVAGSESEEAPAPVLSADPADAADPQPPVPGEQAVTDAEVEETEDEETEGQDSEGQDSEGQSDEHESRAPAVPLFQAPDPSSATTRRSRARKPAVEDDAAPAGPVADGDEKSEQQTDAGDTGKDAGKDPGQDPGKDPGKDEASDDSGDDSGEGEGGGRRRRRRGGRRRRKSGGGGGSDEAGSDEGSEESGDDSDQSGGRKGGGQGRQGSEKQGSEKQGADKQDSDDTSDKKDSGRSDSDAGDDQDDDSGSGDGSSRRRRRRRRSGGGGDGGGDGQNGDDPKNTVTRVRKGRSAEDEITAVSGSTRLEAKKQRRREGREAGRRRAPIVSEAEFLARRESVDRVMVIRQRGELTQIAVLEDKVLVEHYVARESQTSLIGNVYLGRVQNVLPSMEAAFIDIGKGRNAVLYAGEVNWSALGHKDGQPRKIESVLSSGQSVLVQVTKDPVGHKGARLTSQISLAGRFLVYVPDGTTSGISRKLPDTERGRLKTLLKEIVPDSAGVIVRTAAEGASEDELTRDVERLKARWEDIEAKTKGGAPKLLYGEPDLTLKVVRDLFTEDFSRLVIEGADAWETVQDYVAHVAPDLQDRLERFETGENGRDVFAAHRIDEQIAKGLDRKVWLPSGGSLVIDRTEAMTVVDVNTGKFTGSGGNLEETVTKNNLEAAEEIVRQLRLRDIGGIIVVDFIDMVLESNRDLVLRRLVECLGRDRTRHQVAEVTSLGLVQMTRKRIGTGLLEAFSHSCDHCQGRGLVLTDVPVEPKRVEDESRGRGGRRGRGRGDDDGSGGSGGQGGDGRGRQGGRSGQGDRSGQSGQSGQGSQSSTESKAPSPKDVAAMARAHGPHDDDQSVADQSAADQSEGRADVEATVKELGEQSEQAQPEQPADAPQAPVEPPAPVSPPVAVAVTPAEPDAAEEPQDDTPAVPAEPRVVTRTRRSASRSAGQPIRTAEPTAIVVSAPEAEATSAPEPAAAAAPAPRVVTRTRGRSATRPAGPPAGEDGSAGGHVEEGAGEPDDGGTVEHVPVKRKGTRKR